MSNIYRTAAAARLQAALLADSAPDRVVMRVSVTGETEGMEKIKELIKNT